MRGGDCREIVTLTKEGMIEGRCWTPRRVHSFSPQLQIAKLKFLPGEGFDDRRKLSDSIHENDRDLFEMLTAIGARDCDRVTALVRAGRVDKYHTDIDGGSWIQMAVKSAKGKDPRMLEICAYFTLKVIVWKVNYRKNYSEGANRLLRQHQPHGPVQHQRSRVGNRHADPYGFCQVAA